ncbi:hypothetical protein PAXRUDRAFT_148818 [Paxillus rubicundulus Ve08.2h10]|uniref:Uncharacterized protein n=1 Tax=Paxillus rubicundulus Ve08.2h10 TaxID=930991 RepID=A0A0D0E3R1_9AGAM|nr:hypothetical protein PAXRUDRAFT_148818 [Paxillus rubicundulus Ve08.2h10]
MDDLIEVKGAIEGSDAGTGNHGAPEPSQLTAKDTDTELPYASQIPLCTCHAEHEDGMVDLWWQL